MVSVSQFINELRRRNVFRSGVAYVVIAWLLIQVADILLEAFAAPAWAMRAIVIALAVGFPVVLILALYRRGMAEVAVAPKSVFPGTKCTPLTQAWQAVRLNLAAD